MFCPECRAKYRSGFSRCSDCNVELVQEIPERDTSVRKSKRDPGTINFFAALISWGWIPVGWLGLLIAERLPRKAQLPFYILMIAALIYYRFVGAQTLRRKWMQRLNR